MAKRKRLTPAQDSYLSSPEAARPAAAPAAGLSKGVSVGSAPIAQVASETSAAAALQELSDVFANARARGLMIEELPLSAIDETYLVRDRIVQDADDMTALMESIRGRGQQAPIEVVALETPRGLVTHGLISGWRRLTALRRLYKESPEPRFAAIKALVVRPDSAADAYLAMVEENEIRVNLSHYERARIAVRALKEGVFPDQRKALLGLFLNVPRAKRSKIASFVTLVEALDEALHFPTAIPEKLGLALARQIEEDPGFGPALVSRLRRQSPGEAAEELALLQAALEASDQSLSRATEPDLAPQPAPVAAALPAPVAPVDRGGADLGRPSPGVTSGTTSGERIALQVAPGLRLSFSGAAQKIELSGAGVTADLMADLRAWLAGR
jgi:ParB family chromosome partitioning protein